MTRLDPFSYSSLDHLSQKREFSLDQFKQMFCNAITDSRLFPIYLMTLASIMIIKIIMMMMMIIIGIMIII